MKKIPNRIAIVILSLLLVTTLGTPGMMLTQAASNEIQTYAYINVAPNPCGVDQQVTVNFWLSVPLASGELATNMTVVVTHPDQTAETLGPFTADTTGGTYTVYTPTKTGTYTFQFFYGGQTLKGAPSLFNPSLTFAGYIEKPSQSRIVNLTVTDTPATNIPFTPLPASWWERPINAQNVQNWASLSGSWMGYLRNDGAITGGYNYTSSYNPFTTNPTTSHILWTKPWCVGGVAGGELGNDEQSGSYWTTAQYHQKFAPVIMNGILYSTWYTTNYAIQEGIQAVDLYTGETLFVINTTHPLKCGMMVDYKNLNQYGVVGPYIITTSAEDNVGSIGGSWFIYDGLTGKYQCEVANVPSYSFLGQDSNGNIILYAFNSTTGTIYSYPNGQFGRFGPNPPVTYTIENTTIHGPALVMYNLTRALHQLTADWSITPGTVYQWQDGIQWVTQSIPPVIKDTITGQDVITTGLGTASWGFSAWSGDTLVLTNGAIPVRQTLGWEVTAGISATDGQLLWVTNRTGGVQVPFTRISYSPSAAVGVYVDINQVTLDMVAYSLQTGKQVWTGTLNKPMANGNLPNQYDTFYLNTVADTSAGVLYVIGFGGDVWAVNMTKGDIIWSWSTVQANGPAGTETPYGIYPLWVFKGSAALAGSGSDKMLYVAEGHEYSPPLFHNAHLLALNATTGELVWDNLGFDCTATAVAYGILTTFNSYDGQIYGYGKGPSQLTVTAPNVGVTTSTPITISGTITDISAGASQHAVAANFPNGLPCVFDASMSSFMEAVYQQQQMPTNTTGVPIVLSVMDSNGNYRQIGTTASNALGTFSYTWIPDIAGDYTVYASFPGTESYYASNSAAAFYASEPAATPTPQPTQPPSMADLYFVPGIIGVIVAVIVVGAVLLLALRKRP